MNGEEDIQIADIENFVSDKEQQFSHQDLVMRSMRKCLEVGCREMRSGWFNQKTDRKGNTSLVYIDDTRKHFIEAVKTTEMIMDCDLDAKAINKIKKIKEKLKEEFLKLCAIEKVDWDTAHPNVRQQRWRDGIYFQSVKLHPDLPHAKEYIDIEVEAYREIFKELTKLTQRLDFYKAEMFEA